MGGKVSFDDLKEVLNNASMQANFPEADMEQIYEELVGTEEPKTPDSDGSIDFDHFLAALRRNWSPNSCGGSSIRATMDRSPVDSSPVPSLCLENRFARASETQAQQSGSTLPLLPVSGHNPQPLIPLPGLERREFLPIQKVRSIGERSLRNSGKSSNANKEVPALPIADRNKSAAVA